MASDPLKRLLSPREKLGAARQVVIDKAPYYASAVLALIPREAPGLGTFGVTKRAILLWDPAQVEEWTVPEISAVLVHELGHVLRDHSGRQEAMGADHQIWNLAGDCEINDDLEVHGWVLPGKPFTPKDQGSGAKKGYVVPATYGLKDGLAAEFYYLELRKKAKVVHVVMQGQGAGKDTQQGKGGKDKGEGQGGKGEEGEGMPSPGAGWCGSGAGRELPGEPEDKGKAEGRGESDLARIRQEVAEAVIEHASKQRGTVPAGLLRWAEGHLKPPRIPWQTKLARACRRALAHRAGIVDYHYSRIARRQWGVGTGPGRPILPAMRAPVPNVAVALDTSGSVSDEMIRLAMSELNGILLATGVEVRFLAFDADLHAVKRVRTWREATKEIKGGGGTDFQPAFDYLEQPKNRADILIVATDGYAPAPDHPLPGTHVVWLLLGPDCKAPAPWGEVVNVGD